MAVALTTITNVSNQVVPILVNDIIANKANNLSGLAASEARQLQMAPGSEITIETQRLDLGQLERLQGLRLLSFN